jgi:hypothetical protein
LGSKQRAPLVLTSWEGGHLINFLARAFEDNTPQFDVTRTIGTDARRNHLRSSLTKIMLKKAGGRLKRLPKQTLGNTAPTS